jgi:multiple sugar transport system substrate-binding protein
MKRFVLLLVCLMLSLSLFARGTADKGGIEKMESKSITLWYYWENTNHQKILNTLADDFNASQGAVNVKTEYIPFADFKKQLSIGVAADALPDIIIIDNPDHASYAAMGIFADLTDELSSWADLDQYFGGPMASATLDGKLYGLPFGSNCLALYYRDDLLKQAGIPVPTNWDEMKVAAEKLTSGNVMGLGVSALMNEEGTFQFMPWLWSTGATSFEPEKGIDAFRLYKDLVESGAMSPNVINWTQGDLMNQFISGNLAMMINGPWQVPTMRSGAPGLSWKVAIIPADEKNASVLGGENFAVINNDNVAASLEFLRFATSPDKIKTYINDFGYIASRKDVADAQFDGDPIMNMFAQQMQYALPRGPHPRWPEISDAISEAFVSVVVGGKSPETAAADAQTRIDAILGK